MDPDVVEIKLQRTALRAVWYRQMGQALGNTSLQREWLRLNSRVEEWASREISAGCSREIIFGINDISVWIHFESREELLAFYTKWA